MRRVRARWLDAGVKIGGLVALAALGPIECVDPTEIVVELSTDVPCAKVHAVRLYVGNAGEVLTAPERAATPPPACSNGKLGSIVLVPASDQRFVVRAVLELEGASCKTDPASGCIEARRSISFLPHTKLRLPIFLGASCTNVPCGDTTLTCERGACVSSLVDPTKCAQGVCDVDGGAGGGDAGSDAGSFTTCAAVAPPLGAPIWGWHFDEAASPVAPFVGPFAPAVVPAPAMLRALGKCDGALALTQTKVALGRAALPTPPFTVALWLSASASVDGVVVSQLDSGGNGWGLQLTANAGKVDLTAVVSDTSPVSCLSTLNKPSVVWFAVGTTSTRLFLDGTAISTSSGVKSPVTGDADLVLGPFTGTIDELYVYKGVPP